MTDYAPILLLTIIPYHPPVITIGFQNGSYHEQNLVMMAAFEWQDATGIHFVRTDRPQCDIQVDFAKLPYDAGICTPANPVVVSIDSRKGDVRHIALHELGHALGLKHSRHRTDVMYPKLEGPSRLSWRDVQQIRHLQLQYAGREHLRSHALISRLNTSARGKDHLLGGLNRPPSVR